MMKRAIWGVVYILKFHRPIGNPNNRHGTVQWYVGFCGLGRINKRLKEHRQGTGARLTRAAAQLGIGFDLIVSFSGTRADERRVKDYKNTRLFVQREAWKPRYARRDTIPF